MTLITQVRCRDCPAVFVRRSNGHKCCDACAKKNKLAQNRRAQTVYDHKNVMEPVLDLSEATIDAMFTAALAEIRRSGVHRLEAASWNYAGRYREP